MKFLNWTNLALFNFAGKLSSQVEVIFCHVGNKRTARTAFASFSSSCHVQKVLEQHMRRFSAAFVSYNIL